MAFTTIDDPTDYFKVINYTGNGSADHSITGAGHQPDLVWIKNADQADANQLIDSTRGVTKTLDSDSTDGQVTDADTLDAFESDGFRVDADVKVNTSSEDYVAYCWKESATAGFDILTYTGTGSARTVSHSLSAVPHTSFIKRTEINGKGWAVYHRGIGNTHLLALHGLDPAADDASYFNDTDPTSSVFTVGTANGVNQDTGTYIAYLWTSIRGFSKHGHYEANGNANGPFIHTGFAPALVITKDADSASNQWRAFDNQNGYNGGSFYMYPSATTTQSGPEDHMDFHSNGFKLRKNDDANDSGTHVYWAFADSPFVNSNGVPNNSR